MLEQELVPVQKLVLAPEQEAELVLGPERVPDWS